MPHVYRQKVCPIISHEAQNMSCHKMHIRPATYSEIGKLMAIFGNAKSIMRSSGNRHQWDGNYPTEDIIRRDIDNGNCYVLCRKGDIIGTMALIPGPDSTYAEIDGEWPDNESYYVIHRIAAASTGGNIARTMLDWAFGHIEELGCSVIRIDTHRDNCIMKHILTSYGFRMCGVIRLEDGSPRDAYHLKYFRLSKEG